MVVPSHPRRKSVDIGGLLLAAENPGSGYGWGGWDEQQESCEPCYAQTLSLFLEQSLRALKQCHTSLKSSTMEKSHLSRRQLAAKLGDWNFGPHKLFEVDLLRSAYLLFEALFRIEGIQEQVGVSLDQISSFLIHLRQLYRTNDYHNFEHALDVLQATYRFLRSADMVPPVEIVTTSRTWRSKREHDSSDSLITCLRTPDIFALCIAAIGHDVGHPGLTNAFMNNSNTPLAVVYDGVSPLEQMHCYLLLKLMRLHGMGTFLDNPASGTHNRRLLWDTVLATDMTVHNRFMASFQKLLTPEHVPLHVRQVLTCQAIIKCADISNPSRPYCVAAYWAKALSKEWFCQLSLENELKLPSTVYPSNDPLEIAKGQIGFIETFALELLKLTSRGIVEMKRYAQSCQDNLLKWQKLKIELATNAPRPINEQQLATPTKSNTTSDILPFTMPQSCFKSFSPEAWRTVYIRKLPTAVDSSQSSSSDRRDADPSQPSSPCESAISSHMSLLSDTNTSFPNSPPSCADGLTPTMNSVSTIHAAIHTGRRKRNETHRNSWNPHHKAHAASSPASSTDWITEHAALLMSAGSTDDPKGTLKSRSPPVIISDSLLPIVTAT